MNKENIYKTADEIPAIRFYKASKDISYMLKEKEELSEVDKLVLTNEFYAPIKELEAKTLDKGGYEKYLDDLRKKIGIGIRLQNVEMIIKMLTGLEKYKVTDIFQDTKQLKTLLSICKIPFKEEVKDLVTICNVVLKAVTADLKRLDKNKAEQEESNFLKEYSVVNTKVPMGVGPYEIKLSHWWEVQIIFKELTERENGAN